MRDRSTRPSGRGDDRRGQAALVDVKARSRLPSYLFQCGLVTASLLINLL